ncbi:MAG: hypothetical protein HYZ52_02160 [Candidatus Omnitrophica bacterium]|nr:hypothetical protein [Candidatus Omnitrophota bacterium]
MSKIIEALKAHSREISEEKPAGTPTQEELAGIYFAGSKNLPAEKRPDTPLVIKVIEKPRASSLIPWVIASVAFLITALSLFSTKRVFIDIKVIDEKGFFAAPAERAPSEKSSEAPAEAQIVAARDFSFEGAAKLSSTKDGGMLMLVNSSVAPFARANTELDPPLDLSNSKIIFSARGYKGGENVAISLKDSHNLSAFSKGKFYPFPSLSTRWQKAEITFNDSVGVFDKKKVSSLRFDFGSKDTENKPGDTVFIKDIQIVPLG